MAGRYYTSGGMAVVSLFVCMSLAAWFFFFALVALQGVLLNTTSPRVFPGVSLFVQGSLLTVLVCALPLVLSIPSLFRYMGQRPGFALWLPPVWFLGLDQAMLGEPRTVRGGPGAARPGGAGGGGTGGGDGVFVELPAAEGAAFGNAGGGTA